MVKEFKVDEKPAPENLPETARSIGENIGGLMRRHVKQADKFEKETEKAEKNVEGLLLDILLVADSLERILQQVNDHPENVDIAKMKEFVNTLDQQVAQLLARRGVTPMDTAGKVVDPNFTEILEEKARPDCTDFTVLEEIGKGYLIKGKLLRRAKVIVAKKKEG